MPVGKKSADKKEDSVKDDPVSYAMDLMSRGGFTPFERCVIALLIKIGVTLEKSKGS